MKCRFAVLIVIATLMSQSAFGDTDTVGVRKLLGLSLEELMNIDVITASKKVEKSQNAPATVYVITNTDIRQRGYVFLKDVLRDLPGMETIENSFTEQGTLVAVRGVLGNNKTIVMVNGRRVNPPGGEEMMLRSDINIAQAKQIEVVYGLGSTLYGQDAINALINIITERPADSTNVDFMLRGGMYNSKEGVFSFSRRISAKDKGFVGITASLSYADDGLSRLDKQYAQWWNANYAGVVAKTGINEVPRRFDKGFNPFLRIESENSFFQVWHRESSRSSAEGGYAPVLQFADQAIWHDRSTVISAAKKFPLNDNLNINTSISYNRYEIDPETRYVFPVNDSTIFLNDYKYGIGTGVRIEESVDYKFRKKLSFLAGLLNAFYNVIPKATIPGGADPNSDLRAQGGYFVYYTTKGDSSSRVDIPRAYDLSYYILGAYAECQYQLNDELKAVAGLRFDKNSRYAEVAASPRLALIYKLNDRFTFKYIYNKGYVDPSPYFAYNVFDNGQNLNTYNAGLKAEHATSNELSVQYMRKGLSLTGAVYYNTQQNLIVLEDGRISPANLVRDTVYLDPQGTITRELTQTANSGNTTAYGTDIFCNYKGQRCNLWASFSYVYFEQKIGSITNHLDNISPVNIRFGITWLSIKKLAITPSLIFRTTPQNMPNTVGLEQEINNPYAINLHINYNPIERLTIFLDGTNITNHKYALRGVISATPQEPIRLLVGARYTIK